MVIIGSIKTGEAPALYIHRAIFINERLVFDHRLRAKAKVFFGISLLLVYGHGYLVND
jgi:hypothetical protein